MWQKKNKKKCPNDKKEIYNDKYKHTRDKLFVLYFIVLNRGRVLESVLGLRHVLRPS